MSRGPGRFADVSADCAAILQDRIHDEPIGLPAGAGPVWTGGFAFADDGGASAHWSSLPPALLVMPEIAIAARATSTFLTAAACLGGRGGP